MASGLFNLKQVNQAISQGAWSGYIAPRWVEYLVVAGGGGGGSGGGGPGGGGGAGGLLTGIVTVAAGASYSVTLGTGGTGATSFTVAGGAGTNSVFGSIASTGGGGGGSYTGYPPSSGGSGGGAGTDLAPAQGTSGQGNTGGSAPSNSGGGGGGGGAGTIGLNGISTTVGGNGGAGIASAITGTVTTYAGGGGGSTPLSGSSSSVGGVGGGGVGQFRGVGVGSVGAANTGGGGGGYCGGTPDSAGYNGGSGIVVVRYPGNVVFFTGGTVNYNNGYIIHIFTSNGTLAPTAPAPYNTSYQISRSLRVNGADSAYLNRTPASAGNLKTWTWSGWMKRSATAGSYLFSNLDSSGLNGFGFQFTSADTLDIFDLTTGYVWRLQTTQVFRDFSAWYHMVLAFDSTQATSSDRVKLYVNGAQVTAFSATTYPTLNYDGLWNNTSLAAIGRAGNFSGAYLYSYLTEINFIDGQALTPSSFGATSTTTGVWSPIQYTGTYGTNGFYLNFSDNSNTTAATLGKDYSGNGNNWTPNNFSVTAGVTNDSFVDSPTQYGFDTGVGGTVRGNYCILNPLNTAGATPTNGNLAVLSSSTQGNRISTFLLTSGKWYWEGKGEGYVGAITGLGGEAFTGSTSGTGSKSIGYWYGGPAYWDGGNSVSGDPYTSSDTIGIALDMDIGNVKFYKNNTLIHNLTFGSGTVPNLSTGVYPSYNVGGGTQSVDFNFGQRPFTYTAPSGFKAICTQNLPTPTIGATSNTLAGQYFIPTIYTGNGSASRAISNGINMASNGGLVWSKQRSGVESNFLIDNVRGNTKYLMSNSVAAENTISTLVTSFDSTGYSIGNDSGINGNGSTYVSWVWGAGGSGASNSAGSITSTVSANQRSGFSVVTYQGNNTNNATIGHGLGVAPVFVIVKARSDTFDWIVWSKSFATNNTTMFLNTTNAAGTYGVWNSTLPNSSVITLPSSAYVNGSNNYVAYCFAPVDGYSAFGSYVGNGSASGPFVYTGFRPAFLLIRSTGVESWFLFDTARGTYNDNMPFLQANTNGSEYAFDTPEIMSNGFKLSTNNGSVNGSGNTMIYAAFAETPFKYSLAR